MFKNLNDLQNKFTDDSSIVLKIMTNEGAKELDTPCVAGDMRCPKCGTKDGYYLPIEKLWTCGNSECHLENYDLFAKKNLVKENFYASYQLKAESIEDFGVPDELKNACFEKCDKTPELIESMKLYIQNSSGFFTILGASGRGKSYASCAMLEEYRKSGRIGARFVNIPEFFSQWKEYLTGNMQVNTLLAPFLDCPLLVLDDLGTKEPSQSFLELILLLIDKRKKLGTIITSNLQVGELKTCLGDRILSRIGNGKMIQFSGTDRRSVPFKGK